MDRSQLRDKHNIISAASFPDDDPYQVCLEKELVNQHDITKKDNVLSKQGQILGEGFVNGGKEINMTFSQQNNFNKTSNCRQNSNFFEELDAYQSNSDHSRSTSQMENESTSSLSSSETRDNSGMSSTRM